MRRALLQNIQEYTVSELSFALKRQIEEGFSHVRVRGEMGRVSRPGSGHVYLDLKDEKSVLAAVIWKGTATGLKIQPEQGLEVIATGRLTTFPGQSKYQLIIEALEPAGVGALMALLEERRKKLAAEGLFDAARKRALPFLPTVIGVVTSPSGAVIRDILHRLADRFPRHVLVWPALVQGERAAGEIAAAIQGFNRLAPNGPVPRPDLLIVARGGGSLEDLWPFNEEIVVRAAAASTIPLISAVGHETDTTLIDYVSDRRAPTPTAAAEMAVPVRVELMALLQDRGARLSHGQARILADRRTKVQSLGRGLPRPLDLLALARQRHDACAERLPRALHETLRRRELQLAGASARLRPTALRQELQRHHARLNDLFARSSACARRHVSTGEKALAGIRLPANLRANLDRHEAALIAVRARLRPAALQTEMATLERRLGELSQRMDRCAGRHVETATERLTAQVKLLESLSYETVLDRGFALVHREGGGLVTSKDDAEPGLAVSIQFRDGQASAVFGGVSSAPRAKRKTTPQGELF